MQKCLRIVLALFCVSVQAWANWNPYSMDHERFVHLTDMEKRAVVISTMEFMVELESKYNTEVTSSGHSSERFQKYVLMMQKLENFLISSASAAASASPDRGEQKLTDLAGKFSKLLTTLGKNGCIYGGHISVMGTSDGKRFCRHPATIGDKEPHAQDIKSAYLKSTDSCKNPDFISCNPVIFGYDKVGSTEPFCVGTGHLDTGKAHNVSYSCMQKSLAGSDTEVKLRLDVLATAMINNKKTFEDVHKFIFRTCACGDSTIDQGYALYVKPHRTCYSMMNTLRVLKNNECSKLEDVNSTEFAEQWAKYFTKDSVFPDIPPEFKGEFEKGYEGLINPNTVKAICDGAPPITTTPTPETEKVCKAECTVSGGSKVGVEQTGPAGEGSSAAGGEASGGAKSTTPTSTTTWSCKITEASKSTPSTVAEGQPTILDLLNDPADAAGSKALKEAKVDISAADTKTVEFAHKDGKLICEVKIVAPTPTSAKPECDISVPSLDENDTEKKTFQVTATFSGVEAADVKDVVWSGATAGDDPTKASFTKDPKDAIDLKVTFGVKNQDSSDIKPCEKRIDASKPEEDPKAEYKIDTKIDALKSANDPSATVRATVTTKDGKTEGVPAGHYISWTRTGAAADKIKPVKKPKKKPKKSASSEDTPVEGEVVEQETKEEVVVKGEVGTGASIVETRLIGSTYNACATLINKKTGASASGSPSCKPIPALTDPMKNYNPNQNAPGQQFKLERRDTRFYGF